MSLSVFRGGRDEVPEKAKNLITPDPTRTGLGNWSTHTTIPINPNNKLTLLLEGKRTDSTFQPYGLYATVSGVLIGHEWKPLIGIVNTTHKKQLTYEVLMLHEWKLMGAKIYTSSDEYAGTLSSSSN
ncbi:hypothetical protein GCM10011378_02570 [Hymenobacter glacieicola]|uniref:Uncharacterized protein n=1 Tax=Hymenobacter glacieicola TaxID=1562124 RepID=A0ABQ1WGH1_9BACT|nr:hypothetical protein GCM10011378_02570 [Hymenobacter glacieicola]